MSPHASQLRARSAERDLPVRRWLVGFVIVLTMAVIASGAGKKVDPADRVAPAANVTEAQLASASIKPDVPPAPASSAASNARMVKMEVTAYCACSKCCGPKAKGITASGKAVAYNQGRFVAADTDVLPFGSKVLIPGYHNDSVEVIDRGSAIKGNRLDVFFASHQDALQWGRQTVLVTVFE